MGFKGYTFLVTIVVAVAGFLYQNYFVIKLSDVASTESGDIQGIVLKSRGGRDFSAYYGIPFAKPPIGSRRFESPEKFEKWTGIWDGTFYRPLCLQLDFFVTGFVFGSEDCLYLNVFVPKTASTGRLLPVIVTLHGGYFHMGGTPIHGPNFFMDHDIIIVTIAYRLGVLGFLHTGDGAVRGNMGLKDQNLGLQWIQKNIRGFGGDPTRVTLTGVSAGAQSVHYHMLSPRSKNLFSGAIRQSGSALNYRMTMKKGNQTQQALQFGQRLNCPVHTTVALVKCLKNMDPTTLVSGHSDLMNHPTPLDSKFGPSVESVADEDAFLTKDPSSLVKNGNFHTVPLLSGFNADEGLVYSAVLSANETKLNEAIDNWFAWAPKAFHYPLERRDISQKIFDFYFGPLVKGNKTRSEWVQSFTDVYSDRIFNHGILVSMEYERKYLDKMYSYYYDHRGGFSLTAFGVLTESQFHPILTISWRVFQSLVLNRFLGMEIPLNVPGACHGDEVVLLYSSALFSTFFSEKTDLQISMDLVQLWVDFASQTEPLKYGKIVIPPSTNDEEPLKFIRLNKDNPQIIENPIQHRYDFCKTLGF